ncbi:MAG TPA: phosphate ABC transporter ATP-binding protein [Candidatus Sulfomarinibacteraceae bacterium]|nr:phosphate ABC transporter ATP-binding protein [Candidatus Sulfomarinibacteraceae bacterium]
MNKVLFELDGLVKAYDGRTVLQIDSLQIFRGEILAVVGPSGAGKSTMLRLLNFLEPPTSGRIHFEGTPYVTPDSVPVEVRRRITTVFQRPLLLRRSVGANVCYGLSIRGRRNSSSRVDAVLQEVGLKHLAQQPARGLSGGEAQRVAVARAIVLQPDVLLLDEPTANLDPYNVRLIEEIICRQNEAQATTLVMVTHNIFQARRLADRVLFLLDGNLVEASDSKTFFNSPADPRTAAFVAGEMVY